MRGVKSRDRRVEAEAFLVLGQAYLLESRIRLAYEVSSRAHDLFRLDSNSAGQADSLAAMSHAACMLGRSAEAVQAANDAIALCGRGASSEAYAFGYNYLGVAATWSGDFARASEALEASAWFAGHTSEAASARFHPWVNLCFCELLRVVDSERAGRRADLESQRTLVQRGQAMAQSGRNAMPRPGTSKDTALILWTSRVASAHAAPGTSKPRSITSSPAVIEPVRCPDRAGCRRWYGGRALSWPAPTVTRSCRFAPRMPCPSSPSAGNTPNWSAWPIRWKPM